MPSICFLSPVTFLLTKAFRCATHTEKDNYKECLDENPCKAQDIWTKIKTHKGILKGLTKRRQLNKEIKSRRDTFSAIDNVMHL